MKYSLVVLLLGLIVCCRSKHKTEVEKPQTASEIKMDSFAADTVDKAPVLKTFEGLADTTFVRLADFSADFAYDMRYATENNFLKAKV